MSKINLFIVFIVLTLALISVSDGKISDYRMCGNEDCSVIIGNGVTVVQYSSIDPPHLISFARNVKVRIFSKEAGSNPDVWGVEIQGRRGYVNKIHIREEQTIVSSTKLIKVPTELLTTQKAETPVPQTTTTTNPLAAENVQAAVPGVSEVSSTIAASSSVPAEQVASLSNPDVKVEQLAKDAPKTTPSMPSEALSSNSDTKTDATPAVPDIPVNEPLAIKKEAYVTTTATTEKPVLTRQDNVNDTEEVKLEVLAPFADNSKPDPVIQTVTPALKSTIAADSTKISSDEPPKQSIDSKDPIPNTTTANEKLEPSTLKKTLPSSDVVPNVVTESPSTTVTTNLTTAAPALPSTTQKVVPVPAPQAAVTTSTPSGPVTSAPVSTAADTTVPPTTTSPPIESTRPADNPAVPTTLAPKPDDSANIINGTPSTDLKSETLPQIVNETDQVNSSENTTTNIPSSEAVVSKMLQIDDPIAEAKILLQDDELNTTDISSEDSFMDNSVEEYENTTDSIEASDSSENIAPADENTLATPPSFIDPYESLKTQDNGYQMTDLPASNEVVTPPSLPTHHHHDHHHHNHDHKYPAGVQVPPFYPIPTQKPYIPNYPSSGDSAQVPVVETAQNASDASSEVVNESIPVPNEVETPISVNPIQPVPSEKVTSDSVEGVGSVEEILPPLLEVLPPVDDLTIEGNVITETETIDDGPGMFSNLWNSITGLFASSDVPDDSQLQQDTVDFQQKVNDMLFTTPEEAAAAKPAIVAADEYCEHLTPDSCPQKRPPPPPVHEHSDASAAEPSVMEEYLGLVTGPAASYDEIFRSLLEQIVGMSSVIVFTLIAGLVVLVFLLGHGCIGNNRREQSLLSKLNILERKLMTSGKECELLKNNLVDTRHKLTSIEDNSFGSNEMVIALKQELDNSKQHVGELLEQVQALEKELDTATEAGLELNKMVTELLSNQSGSDSIISTVDDMQRQLNEQQATTESINAVLAEKSRENSELQVKLNDITDKYDNELEEVMRQNEALMAKYTELESQSDEQRVLLEEQNAQLDSRTAKELQQQTAELTRLTKDLVEYRAKYDEVRLAHQASESRVQTLGDLVKQLKKGSSADELGELMNVTDMKAKLLALTKEKDRLTDKLEGELDARKLLEDHVKVVGEEVSALRQGFNLAEKDKLEAQTRLEVLSTYFKEKETQLQKELSLKEAITMKQQGETTSTVERIRSLQSEIQELRSQNDSLKAEIEAQIAAHKAQLSAAENRAHESWLNARQVERRFEEARSDASALRRKLTSLAGGSNGTSDLQNRHNSTDGLANDLSAPSPILLDPTGSSLMPGGGLPLQFLPPPPFMAPPFMPPPPFLPPPPGEMRPPPLGRLMSPPPLNSRYSPVLLDDRDRYDRGGGGGGGRYSPDDRYDDYRHSDMLYETETDFSPPPSPEPRGYHHSNNNHRDNRDRQYQKRYSPPPPPPSKSDSRSKKSSKGGLSSGSVDSLGSRKSHGGKV